MRLRYVALVVAVFAGLLSGCGREQTRLSVTARDFGFTGVGESISGGNVDITFRNEGKANHELAFFDIGNTSFETFRKDFPKILQGGPFASYMKRLSGAGELDPGDTLRTTLTLPKGTYVMMCALDDAPGEGEETGKPHYELGMRQNVTVDGPQDVEVEEAPGGTFHAKDYTFEPPSDLQAGKNTFAFVNDGPEQWHFMTVQEWPKGTTAAKAEASFGNLLKLGDAPPPAGFVPPKDFHDTFVFSPGMGQTFEANFRSGYTYLAACFIQDLKGGAPHAVAHKMYKAWTVS